MLYIKKVPLPCILLLFVISMLAGCAGKSATGNLTASATAEPQELRIMSYNIRHANPPSKKGVIDMEAIVRVIRSENPDLVALQEVDVNTVRSGKVNQAKVLAKMLGMHYFFAKAIDFDGGEYGVAILSRYPILDSQAIPLPEEADPEAEDRVLARASITLPDGRVIYFGSTHLDVMSAANRLQQIKKINTIAASSQLPFILAGDLNDLPESLVMAELGKEFTLTCQSVCEPTFPQDIPNRTIDYIAFSRASPLKVLTHKVVPESYASDHLPIVATLRF
ncbi:endonuclease/exonuclease/phosphatase family protein [Pontibacter sp. H249]|uniref:endonuclease/exonuclease/phosphatase family protein n=1 Tax=Pontibacter sp. H249 TaxID=3133420 RepID=UPI0030C23AB6